MKEKHFYFSDFIGLLVLYGGRDIFQEEEL